jgi:MFS family permease
MYVYLNFPALKRTILTLTSLSLPVAASASATEKPDHSISVASWTTSPRPSDAAPNVTVILSETNARAHTAKAYSPLVKWLILTGMLLVQISQNYNAAVYNSAVPDLAVKFSIAETTARYAQMIFLVMYAFGCELWAPFSEEFGRKWILQTSLTLVNGFQILVAVAPSFPAVFAARALGGLSSAGGSVTLGMVADMFDPADQFQAVAFTCFGSVVGSVIAPIVSGTVATRYSGAACIWVSVGIGFFTQAVHLSLPETRPEEVLDAAARHLRRASPEKYAHVRGPREVRGGLRARLSVAHVARLMFRPYKLLATEPIVLFLSLLSGFSDSLIFSGLDSFGLILSRWAFTAPQVGLSFFALFIGYAIGYATGALHFLLSPVRRALNTRVPEQRLWLLLFLVLFMPIGLCGLAFTSLGPAYGIHWVAPLLFVLCIGVANYAIYLHTIDYLVAAYGPFAASATGGNGFCRDLLAGLAAVYTHPMYDRMVPGPPTAAWKLTWPTLLLAGLGVALAVPVYYFYFCGHRLRAKSAYATKLEQVRAGEMGEGELASV